MVCRICSVFLQGDGAAVRIQTTFHSGTYAYSHRFTLTHTTVPIQSRSLVRQSFDDQRLRQDTIIVAKTVGSVIKEQNV